jgi:hypothetical protein
MPLSPLGAYLLPDIDAWDGAAVDNFKIFIHIAIKLKIPD